MPLIVNGKSQTTVPSLGRCFSLSDIARSFQSDECADVYDDTRVSFPEFFARELHPRFYFLYLSAEIFECLIVGKEYEETTRERKENYSRRETRKAV